MPRIAPPLTAVTLALASCGGGGASDAPTTSKAPFDFATTEEHPFEIEVLVDGAPAPFARVQLLAPLPPLAESDDPHVGTELYATGLTDDSGHWRGSVAVPSTCIAFDVLVQLPGTSGPLEPAGYAPLWGAFAPSARLQVDASSLAATTIHLQQD